MIYIYDIYIYDIYIYTPYIYTYVYVYVYVYVYIFVDGIDPWCPVNVPSGKATPWVATPWPATSSACGASWRKCCRRGSIQSNVVI